MKIGIAPLVDHRTLGEVARNAEAAGFHSIWLPEHVVLFDEYESRYPYSENGRIHVAAEPSILDPLLALSYLAGITSTIRLGTGICLLPQRNPIYTAKEVATADCLSGGRVDFGVGVGWLREEFEALGVPFEHRGSRARDYVGVLKTLWQDPVSQHDGPYYTLPPVRQYPKPIQQPHPPIYFGGESDAALRRVADLGQGWYGFNLGPEEAAERVRTLEAMLRERGRSLHDIEVSICPSRRPVDADMIRQYADAGVDQVIVALSGRRLAPEAIAATAEELIGTATAR